MNERERLTEHLGDGVRHDNGEYIITCYPKNKNLNPVDKLAVKLCELEDKIENGTLIELPCKVGDTVYVITERHPCYACMCVGDFCHKDCHINDKSKLVVKEAKVFYLLFQEMSNKIQVEVKKTKHLVGHFLGFDIKDFGKTIFLTKEEAEKALAERVQK